VHKWVPCHREPLRRSHVDKTIVLLKIGERYVPIVESATASVSPAQGQRRATRRRHSHQAEGRQRTPPPPPVDEDDGEAKSDETRQEESAM